MAKSITRRTLNLTRLFSQLTKLCFWKHILGVYNSLTKYGTHTVLKLWKSSWKIWRTIKRKLRKMGVSWKDTTTNTTRECSCWSKARCTMRSPHRPTELLWNPLRQDCLVTMTSYTILTGKKSFKETSVCFLFRSSRSWRKISFRGLKPLLMLFPQNRWSIACLRIMIIKRPN